MNDESIDIKGMDKGKILAALYNASQPLGLGFLQATPENMTVEEARGLTEEYAYFDYLKGRVMKVDLSGDMLNPYLYDRDNGQGAARKALEGII